MTGATATSPRGCRRDKFGSALKAKGGNFFYDSLTLTVRAFDFRGSPKNYLLKILLAILALKFIYGHKHSP